MWPSFVPRKIETKTKNYMLLLFPPPPPVSLSWIGPGYFGLGGFPVSLLCSPLISLFLYHFYTVAYPTGLLKIKNKKSWQLNSFLCGPSVPRFSSTTSSIRAPNKQRQWNWDFEMVVGCYSTPSTVFFWWSGDDLVSYSTSIIDDALKAKMIYTRIRVGNCSCACTRMPIRTTDNDGIYCMQHASMVTQRGWWPCTRILKWKK